VVNVGVLTEGFDCPPVSCIIVARPTKSLVLWRQMCGRGARVLEGKTRYLVLDHAGNAWRHGFPDDPKVWTLDGKGEAPEESREPFRCCVACGYLIRPAASPFCSKCGAEQPETEKRELAERDGELERLKAAEEQRKAREVIVRKLAETRGLGEDWIATAMEEA